MNRRQKTSFAGAVACLVTLFVLVIPVITIRGTQQPLGAYYASGPVGAGGIGFFALLGIVVFLSGERGSADPATVAGISLVLSLALVSLAVLWFFSIGDTLLFSFSNQHSWLEWHPVAVIATGLVILAASGGYTAAVIE
ncbi:MAG: hypothetical protein J07HR59_01178 [Halorubrum sp. J07HR59]|jgi:hypothetical protein|nr:MAG: hypothetical protein J07AB56_09930 [Candidatus Nanosalinarum sp. J07AB56]ERH04051.1 MAG: hypothetical protein J07HR59_01178 [Halorubrum sp. J07HR59]